MRQSDAIFHKQVGDLMTFTDRYTYFLPSVNNEPKQHTTAVNSLIIIGANGSGKSKLGAWIEQQNFEGVHRISAQRNINFSEKIPLKSYSEAEDIIFYGGTEKAYHQSKDQRWEWGRCYTTKLLDDFDDVLAALIAQLNNENQQYVEDCKYAEEHGAEKPHTRESSLDRLFSIWDQIFPHRQLKMKDAHFAASISSKDPEYSGTEMSDGERSVLYLAAQVLCVPKNKILIIDEPEVHLHPSLMSRLWQALENARPDCLFVFITHDTQLAAFHKGSDKVWVKSFDGEYWEWNFIPESDLPEQLLLELLGNRKNVLFVEGTSNSYDTQLYSALYPSFYVVPCGGCSQVISNTKAFNAAKKLHSLAAYGLIDRDYRSDEELTALKSKGIFCLEVAEIENLFLVEPVLRIAAERFACDNIDNVIQEIKDYIIHQRFANELTRQIEQATKSCLKTLYSSIEVTEAEGDTLSEKFKNAIAKIKPEEELLKQEAYFTDIKTAADYEKVLKVYNAKGLSSSIGHFFGINDKEYCKKIIGLLHSDHKEKLLDALKPYVPSLPKTTSN